MSLSDAVEKFAYKDCPAIFRSMRTEDGQAVLPVAVSASFGGCFLAQLETDYNPDGDAPVPARIWDNEGDPVLVDGGIHKDTPKLVIPNLRLFQETIKSLLASDEFVRFEF
jgi:hypothetical protein